MLFEKFLIEKDSEFDFCVFNNLRLPEKIAKNGKVGSLREILDRYFNFHSRATNFCEVWERLIVLNTSISWHEPVLWYKKGLIVIKYCPEPVYVHNITKVKSLQIKIRFQYTGICAISMSLKRCIVIEEILLCCICYLKYSVVFMFKNSTKWFMQDILRYWFFYLR